MNIKSKLFICQEFNKITILVFFLGELMAIESIQRFLLNFCLGVALTLTTSPVWAADKITFFYPPFGQFDVLVKDLELMFIIS